MIPTREQIGHILYECEKKRGEQADAVMKGISPKASDALLMEPWEECKDSFLSDADAVLGFFRSAASTVEPVADEQLSELIASKSVEIQARNPGIAEWGYRKPGDLSVDLATLCDAVMADIKEAKRRLDADIPKDAPVHPVSAFLTGIAIHVGKARAALPAAAPTTSPNPSSSPEIPDSSPEPDAVRKQIASIKVDADSDLDTVLYAWWEPEYPSEADKALARKMADKALDALAALSRPAHGDTREALSADLEKVQCELDATMLRVADLSETLENIRAAIMEADPAVLCDTLWVPQRISPAETAVDHIDLALARDDRDSGVTRS